MQSLQTEARAECAFAAYKAEIDDLMAQLAGLSGERFGVSGATWGHVGGLSCCADFLRRAVDAGSVVKDSLTGPAPQPSGVSG